MLIIKKINSYLITHKSLFDFSFLLCVIPAMYKKIKTSVKKVESTKKRISISLDF